MKTNFPYLERLHRPVAGSAFACAAAVNLHTVGTDKEFRRACAVAALGRLPDCEHLDAYTWLETDSDGTPFVRIELLCARAEDPLPDLGCYAHCPERLVQPVSFSRPALVAAAVG